VSGLQTSSLAGKRIVVTRAPHQVSEMASLLQAHGAEPILYPCIEIAPPADSAPLDSALREAASYDWLVLTSVNTALILKQRLDHLGIALPPLKVAAIGPSTAAAARDMLGIRTSLIPERYAAEYLAATLIQTGGTHILLPQADIARPILAESLIESGAKVNSIEAYRTVLGKGGADVPQLLRDRQIDAITFTSGSTAENFMVRFNNEGGDPVTLEGVCIAAIGPITADAVRDAGLPIHVMPSRHTLDGLIAALGKYFSKVIHD
jgi:uroporphyrinogen-III synthase